MRARLVTVLGAAVVWTALWGGLDPRNLVAGLLVGLVISLVVPRRRLAWQLRPLRLLALAAWFAVELVKANVTVAWQVLTWPRRRFRPGVVEVPVAAAAPGLLTVVANLITLTPGTLTVDADLDRRVLRVHALHLEDRAALRRTVLALERRVVEALAPDDLRDAARQRWQQLEQPT